MQEVLSLLFIKVFTGTTSDILLDLFELEFTVHDAQHLDDTLLEIRLLEQLHLLFNGKWHAGADEVQHHQMIVDILDGELSLVGDIFVLLDVIDTRITQVGYGCHELGVSIVGNEFRSQMNLTLQVRTGTFQRNQITSAQSLNNHCNVVIGVGKFKNTDDLCEYTVFV